MSEPTDTSAKFWAIRLRDGSLWKTQLQRTVLFSDKTSAGRNLKFQRGFDDSLIGAKLVQVVLTEIANA